MTKEEILQTFSDINYAYNNSSKYDTLKRMLDELTEPCEDAVSRAELLRAIDTYDKFGCDANTKLVPYQDYYVPYIHYYDVVNCIKGMPPVTPKRKTLEGGKQ